jgi:hypothetical protein
MEAITMTTIKIPKEIMLDILDSGGISDTIVENSRWSILHKLIFQHEGKVYKTGYSVGATEEQYERPWEYENEVECIEVKLVEKVVKVWEEV